MTAQPKKSAARAIADVSTGTLLATVEIAVPPERVFRALTSEELTSWWGAPDAYQTTSWRGDLRPGGQWRCEGRSLNGDAFAVEGEFLEVDPPHKLVQTWKPGWETGPATTITYRLEPIEGGTRVTVRHEGFADRVESCRSHTNGWERVLGWLAHHFAGTPNAARKYFLFKLIGPRPSFPQDITADERQIMADHAAYWRTLLAKEIAIVFGPVADPAGAWGAGIVQVDDEQMLTSLRDNDPTILSQRGFHFEILPMWSAVTRA